MHVMSQIHQTDEHNGDYLVQSATNMTKPQTTAAEFSSIW